MFIEVTVAAPIVDATIFRMRSHLFVMPNDKAAITACQLPEYSVMGYPFRNPIGTFRHHCRLLVGSQVDRSVIKRSSIRIANASPVKFRNLAGPCAFRRPPPPRRSARPVLRSYHRRLRSPVPSWTIRLSGRSSRSTSPRFSRRSRSAHWPSPKVCRSSAFPAPAEMTADPTPALSGSQSEKGIPDIHR